MSIPFKGRLFCQNPMYNCGVIDVESWTISHTFAVIFAATAPHPRWRRKPCNGLLYEWGEILLKMYYNLYIYIVFFFKITPIVHTIRGIYRACGPPNKPLGTYCACCELAYRELQCNRRTYSATTYQNTTNISLLWNGTDLTYLRNPLQLQYFWIVGVDPIWSRSLVWPVETQLTLCTLPKLTISLRNSLSKDFC